MTYSKKEKEGFIKEILERIAKGESVRKVLESDELPCATTFFDWVDNDEELAKQYTRACARRADVIFEQIIEIADSQEDDLVKGKNGEPDTTNHNAINRNRLQVDARKWVAARMSPRKYGDKIDHTTDGEKITAPPVINIIHNDKGLDLSAE